MSSIILHFYLYKDVGLDKNPNAEVSKYHNFRVSGEVKEHLNGFRIAKECTMTQAGNVGRGEGRIGLLLLAQSERNRDGYHMHWATTEFTLQGFLNDNQIEEIFQYASNKKHFTYDLKRKAFDFNGYYIDVSSPSGRTEVNVAVTKKSVIGE